MPLDAGQREIIDDDTGVAQAFSDLALLLPIMATLLGPHNVPAEAFAPAMRESWFAAA